MTTAQRPIAALLCVLALSACTSVATAPARTDAPATPTGAAEDLLETLAVKGRAPKTGYDRDAFGPAWTDDNGVQFGHNGCDTRNDILRRDLADQHLDPDTHGCVVDSGELDDPYTGQQIRFVRGETSSSAVQIDHVVALSDAWQKGAQQWTDDTRRDFANDPLELLAVDGPTNGEQGRRRRRHLAPAEQALPLRVRHQPGADQGQVRPLGDAGRARRDGARARFLPARIASTPCRTARRDPRTSTRSNARAWTNCARCSSNGSSGR